MWSSSVSSASDADALPAPPPSFSEYERPLRGVPLSELFLSAAADEDESASEPDVLPDLREKKPAWSVRRMRSRCEGGGHRQRGCR